MRPVDGVARLETHHTLPAPLSKLPARLDWRKAILCEGLIRQSDDAYRSSQQHIALLIDNFYAWMRLFYRPINLACLVLFIIPIFLFKQHHRLQRPLFVHEREPLALFQTYGLLRGY